MIAHRLRRLLLSVLASAALAMTCAPLLPTPVRADDFTKCLSGFGDVILAGPESALEVLENPEMWPCLSLVEDPEFDALVGVLAALKAKKDGAFSTVDQCKNMLPSLLVDVAAQANMLTSTATAEWDCACRVAVVGLDALKRALDAYDNLVNSCSALAQDIYCDTVGGTDDACSGVGPPTPPMPKQDDACKAPEPGYCSCDPTLHKECKWDHCVVDAQHFSLHCWMDDSNYSTYVEEIDPNNPPPPPPLPDQWQPKSNLCVSCMTHQTYKPWSCTPAVDPNQFSCGYGSQCGVNNAWLAWYNGNRWKPAGPLGPQSGASWSKCVSCDTVTNGAPIANGLCGCKNGYQPLYGKGLSGKQTLLACSCPAPMKEGKFMGQQLECRCPVFGQVPRLIGGKLVCACPPGQQLENGLCRACTNKERYDPEAMKCIPWQGKPWQVPPPVPPGGGWIPPPGRPPGATPTPQRPPPRGPAMGRPQPVRPLPGMLRRAPPRPKER